MTELRVSSNSLEALVQETASLRVSDTKASVLLVYPAKLRAGALVVEVLRSKSQLFADSVTESGSASSTVTQLYTAGGTISEAGSASATTTAVGNFAASRSESASASTSLSAAGFFPGTVDESGSADTSMDATGSFVATVDETGTASTSMTATGSFVASLTAAASASTSMDATGSFVASLDETGSADTALDSTGSFVVTVDETGDAESSEDSTGSFVATLDESGSADTSMDATGSFAATLAEHGSATATVNSTGSFTATLAEHASAASLVSTDSVIHVGTVTETAHAKDRLDSGGGGGGGGGAAGPNGVGSAGEAAHSDGIGGYGGAADGGTVAAQFTPGDTGNSGTELNGVVGLGSGGAGGSFSSDGDGQTGGNGGNYGGGGGGGGGTFSGFDGAGGLGGEGLVFIQYTSTDTSLTVTVLLDKDSSSPWIVPSDWSNTNTIMVIGRGGCGDAGRGTHGGQGGIGGDIAIVTNTTILAPADTLPVSIPTEPCSGGATSLGSWQAAHGGNGNAEGTGSTTHLDPGPGGTRFSGAAGGTGGVYAPLSFGAAVSLAEHAAAVDEPDATVHKRSGTGGPDPIFATDVYEKWNPLLGGFDFTIENEDLASHRDLVTSIVLSLFCDRRALADDELPDPFSSDRKGWWGDAFLVDDPNTGQVIGSRLWLLSRSKSSAQLPIIAQGYVTEALAWLTKRGVASKVDVDTFFIANDPSKLGIVLTIYRRGEKPLTLTFTYAWDQVRLDPVY